MRERTINRRQRMTTSRPNFAKRGALLVGLACLGVLFTLLFASTENLGPQDMVQTSDGDIHRHDFVTRYGWPVAIVERFRADWFVYTPGTVRNTTPEQRRAWNAYQGDRLERNLNWRYRTPESRIATMRRYRADV